MDSLSGSFKSKEGEQLKKGNFYQGQLKSSYRIRPVTSESIHDYLENNGINQWMKHFTWKPIEDKEITDQMKKLPYKVDTLVITKHENKIYVLDGLCSTKGSFMKICYAFLANDYSIVSEEDEFVVTQQEYEYLDAARNLQKFTLPCQTPGFNWGGKPSTIHVTKEVKDFLDECFDKKKFKIEVLHPHIDLFGGKADHYSREDVFELTSARKEFQEETNSNGITLKKPIYNCEYQVPESKEYRKIYVFEVEQLQNFESLSFEFLGYRWRETEFETSKHLEEIVQETIALIGKKMGEDDQKSFTPVKYILLQDKNQKQIGTNAKKCNQQHKHTQDGKTEQSNPKTSSGNEKYPLHRLAKKAQMNLAKKAQMNYRWKI